MARPSDTTEARPLVGVGAITCRGSKLLLIQRAAPNGKGTWSTPGGCLENGESFESCARRETAEETGIAVTTPKLLTVTNDVLPERQRHHVTIWMVAEWHSGEGRPVERYEVAQVRWCEIDQLPQPLFLPFANLLRTDAFARLEESLAQKATRDAL